MINNKEVDAVTLSATKKDFYQIWNELLETAGKLSERWSPTSTNESDPGIVLLKVLTAIADKLNYNIDKNTLEAFMPSAAQEESMRKLCDMMGYNMKYYRSATTNVKIAYVGEEPLTSSTEILIDKFTNIKNSDNTVNYVTTVAKTISNTESVVVIPCIEGELVECETDDDNIISITLLDDNFRYYLPETRIAENGIFIYNINDGQVVLSDGEAEWTRVDNLNIQPIGDRVFKFGFDSALNIPYIQFPEDIATIMEDGLKIYYIRTNGVNGNISVNELSTMDEPASWSESYSADGTASAQWDKDVDFTIKNTSSATNGKNPETLKQAYNNYKKTIGTFDTLVTCRDYMNKIYQMTVSETDTTPLVSNIIVSDIRDDINNMVTICSFNDYGICYKDVSLQDENKVDKITHFDLLLYPFKTYNNLSTETDYKNSFTYSELTADEIEAGLTEYKTIAHNIRFPQNGDIACIKVYLKLKAKITTVRKVNKAEEAGVLASIYRAIYSQFNMREIDFNEELVYDDIEKCIEDADTRIKNVLWEDPELVVKACMVGGEEYTLTGLENNSSDTDTDQNRLLYDQLLIRNILAGKIDLFEYVTDFKTDYTEAPSTAKYIKYAKPEASWTLDQGQIVFPRADDTFGELDGGVPRPAQIVKLGSECKLNIRGMANTGTTADITLGDNEVIQFRLPNFFTTVTYPNNVNYYAKLDDKKNGIPADAEYKLKAEEYVLFNYTSKNTDDSGAETMDIHNIVYTAGSILRPNFDLKDSETIKTASTSTSYISWRKTSGYNFNKASATIYPASATDSWQDPTNLMGGMFCLTTEEQIEARERVEVTLDKPFTYYYWNRNDDDEKITADKNRSESEGSPQGYITFEFDSITADGKASYILKDNEYFFYTDKNKLDIAFYGSGTEIVAKMSSGNNLTLIKRYNNAVDTASIVDNGLASQIPWERIDLKAETTSGAWKTLTLTEYQYVTLGTEDTLNYIEPVDTDKTELTNNWIKIYKANYTKSDGTAKQLPAIYIDGLYWEGRSRLDFNMGPEQAQILRRTNRVQDTITGYARVWTSEKEEPPSKFVEFTPAAPNDAEPIKTVTLKSNYGIQGSTDTLDVSISEYDEETDTYQPLNDFKLKLFETKSEVSEKITLNNFADHLTFIDFNELNFGDKPGEITLNTTLSDSAKYGLIMLYYSDPSAETGGENYTAGASFEITSVPDTKVANVSYFNSADTLTPTTTGGSTYKLKLGMQIIQLENVKSIKLIPDTAFKSTVVISDLQEVIGINPKLNYLLTSDEMEKITTDKSIADAQLESVLALIKNTLGSLNDSYYYGSPIDNSSKIDLNTKLDTETMSNARTYFDYNNVNNKFVISEIDANALKNGITLASSSRQ